MQDSNRQSGLLLVSAGIPADRQEFVSWYFEHVRDRMDFPEFKWMSRGVSLSNPGHHIACYGLTDMDILVDPKYTQLRSNRSQRELVVMDSMNREMARSMWDAVGGFGAVGGPYMVVVRMRYRSVDQRVLDWYKNRHLPFLETVPGWLGVRTFARSLEASEKEHVAIHWLSDLAIRRSAAVVEEKDKDERQWFLKGVKSSSYEEFEVLQWQ